ncbi:MAG: hypothetical protein AAF481_15370 [Acidobacteriota bacterium]
MHSPQTAWLRRAAIASATLGVLACGVWAFASFDKANSEVSVTTARVEAAETTQNTEMQGMRAYLDSETGELRAPTRDELAADSLAASIPERTDAGLSAVRMADGRLKADLQGRYMSYSVARIDADGGVEQDCVNHASAAEAFAHGHGPSVEE